MVNFGSMLRVRKRLLAAACLFLPGLWSLPAMAQQGAGEVAFVVPPVAVVEKMLEVAKVTAGDYLMDLGSGDGRIVITAAKKYGARGMGVDLDPQLVLISKDRAWREGVREQVEFYQRNLFNTDLRPATVVTLHLTADVNLKLRPKLLAELRPGARLVSHRYGMGDWQPDETMLLRVPEEKAGETGGSSVMLWTVPANVIGTWELKLIGSQGASTHTLELDQKFQHVEGALTLANDPVDIETKRLEGNKIEFSAKTEDGSVYKFSGKVNGKYMDGEAELRRDGQQRTLYWKAQRQSALIPLDPAARR